MYNSQMIFHLDGFGDVPRKVVWHKIALLSSSREESCDEKYLELFSRECLKVLILW